MDELNSILEMTKDQSTQKEQDEVSVNILLEFIILGFLFYNIFRFYETVDTATAFCIYSGNSRQTVSISTVSSF